MTDGPMLEEGSEELATLQQLLLPNRTLHGLWNSLIFDTHVKFDLLEYMSSAMLFSQRAVDPNVVGWNRVVLLHGPPGTGKTSLCRALAQKLSIRLAERYAHSHLLEINAHSLFSKWFSESGKLVTKLFQYIQELIDDDEALVFVLIDEIESLAAARTAALAGSEPSDAIRVVNAVLTQLDLLKTRSNVIILTTSNITQAVDLAFLDRVDIKQYIGLPTKAARFAILHSCLMELMRVGIIQPAVEIEPYPHIESVVAVELNQIAEATDGFSGRSLRKLPLQAHARFVQKNCCTMQEFLKGLMDAVEVEKMERAALAT